MTDGVLPSSRSADGVAEVTDGAALLGVGQMRLLSAAVPAERLGGFLRGGAFPREQAGARPIRAAAR